MSGLYQVDHLKNNFVFLVQVVNDFSGKIFDARFKYKQIRRIEAWVLLFLILKLQIAAILQVWKSLWIEALSSFQARTRERQTARSMLRVKRPE